MYLKGTLGKMRYAIDREAVLDHNRSLQIKCVNTFKRHLLEPKSGIKYNYLPNRSSREGEYPANQSGALYKSIKGSYTFYKVTFGSNVPYSKDLIFLDRQMSRDVLQEEMAIDNFPKFTKVMK